MIDELVIQNAINDALTTMQGMVGNPGQQAIYERYLEPAFVQEAQASINDNQMRTPNFKYREAVEIITETGVEIVNRAHEQVEAINKLMKITRLGR
jgi:hypothetical protein